MTLPHVKYSEGRVETVVLTAGMTRCFSAVSSLSKWRFIVNGKLSVGCGIFVTRILCLSSRLPHLVSGYAVYDLKIRSSCVLHVKRSNQ